MTNSIAKIYECEVMHHRLKPLRNSFVYRVFMLDVDLDSLPELCRRTRWLGHNRFNLFSVNDRDHVDVGSAGGIRENLTKWLSNHGIEIGRDVRIRLVTFPRVLGYGFNPVSFFYLSSSDGSPLMSVVEVVNTFREMKLYVVDGSVSDGVWNRTVAKDFYVSPFSDPADSFDFRLGIPREEWRVNIDDLDVHGKVLVSSIRGRARDLTSSRLMACAFKYPLLSLKIIGLIHWHALLLWLKRVPFFRKTDRIESQREVLRAHRSLHRNPP